MKNARLRLLSSYLSIALGIITATPLVAHATAIAIADQSISAYLQRTDNTDITANDVTEVRNKTDGGSVGSASHSEFANFGFASTTKPGSAPIYGARVQFEALDQAPPPSPSSAWSTIDVAGKIVVKNDTDAATSLVIYVDLDLRAYAHTSQPNESASSHITWDIFWDGASIINRDDIAKTLNASCPKQAGGLPCDDEFLVKGSYAFAGFTMDPHTTHVLLIDPTVNASAVPIVGTVPLISLGLGLLGLLRRRSTTIS